MNISHWIDTHARYTPSKVAIYFEGQAISYTALATQIRRTAAMLNEQLGVRRGDRVSILAHNIPEYLVALFACARIGAILNPLNWRLAVPELLYILENAETSVLLLESLFAELAAPMQATLPACKIVGFDFKPDNGERWDELLADANSDVQNAAVMMTDAMLLVYTSGTTGHPKGAVLSQNALLFNALNSVHMQDLTSDDHALTALPLFHVGGLNNQTTPALYCGATVTLQRRFVPDDVLRAISAEPQPTITCLVPATMQACIASPLWAETDFSKLRLNVTGSTIVPEHLSDHFRAVGVAVLEMYGCTETAPVSVYHRLDSDFSKRGSTGLPGIHCEVCVVDAHHNHLPAHQEGEILLRGPNIMDSYWRNPQATTDALIEGWFHTGDIGYFDEDGYIYIKDRKKNMIISGGENIYAAEVELVLNQHPRVLESALIGVPDEKWGERPVAFVVCSEETTSEELNGFMQGQLARYKLPRAYNFVESLPKNALGKIQHFLIRKQALL